MKLLIVVALAAMLLSAANARVTHHLVEKQDLRECMECIMKKAPACESQCKGKKGLSFECIKCHIKQCSHKECKV